MINRDDKMSILEQCDLLSISRSTAYYSVINLHEEDDQKDMAHVLREYSLCPFYGRIKIAKILQRQGHDISIERARRLMKRLGIQAIYSKRNLSIPNIAHKKYPYLLKDLSIYHPNHVWSTDITYVRVEGCYVYLMAIIDIFSRKVLSWDVSNTMDVPFCLRILKDAVFKYGAPEILNTDQGSQYTSDDFTVYALLQGIRLSMDGKGRALDNIYIERLWRTVKYENIYLHDYESMILLRGGLDKYFRFYNAERIHQSLDYLTPDEMYSSSEVLAIVA